MAIRKPKPMSIKRTLDFIKSLVTSVADKLEATDGALAVIDDIRGIADMVATAKAKLCMRDRRFGRALSKAMSRLRDRLDARFAEGYEAGAEDGGLEWLDELAVKHPEGSKWSDPYVRRLAALEHCDEVLELHRAEARAKARGSRGKYEPALERELADLYCILSMERMASPSFNEAVMEREGRFRP